MRHVLMASGARATQAVSAMVAGILVARFLGAEAKGTLSVLTALASMGVLLASLGIPLSGIYFLGRFKEERDLVISNNLVAGALGGVLTAGLLVAVATAFSDAILHGIEVSLLVLYACSVPFYFFNEFGRGVLFGEGKIRQAYLPDILGGGGLLIGTALALLVFGEHIVPLVALRVVVEVVVTFYVLFSIRRQTPFRLNTSRPMLRRQLGYGLRNYASSLMWLFLLQSDIVLCNHFLGSGDTGVYSVAVSLGLPITMLAAVVGSLTFQRVSSEASRATRIANTNRSVRILVPLVAVSIIATGALAFWLIPVVYGSAFSGAAAALALLLPGFLAYSIEIVLMNFLAGEGSPPIVVWAPAVGLAINVAANSFVIPRWGIDGASVTSSAAYGVVLLLVLRYYMRSTSSSLRDLFATRGADVDALLGGRAAAGPAAEARA